MVREFEGDWGTEDVSGVREDRDAWGDTVEREDGGFEGSRACCESDILATNDLDSERVKRVEGRLCSISQC